jgi:hypothetical protein
MLINHASVEDLARLPGVSRDTAETIARERPFQSWAEVHHSGIDMDQVKVLKEQGVEFGPAFAGPIIEPGSGGSAGSPEGNIGKA